MVEKPIASDLRGADRMLEAAAKYGIRLHGQLPARSSRASQWSATGRWRRASSAGPGCCGSPLATRDPRTRCSPEFLSWLLDPVKNGGGALQDLGTYGAALYAWYFGRAEPGERAGRDVS